MSSRFLCNYCEQQKPLDTKNNMSFCDDCLIASAKKQTSTAEQDILSAAREWHKEMTRIGNATIDGAVRTSVTPELHNAMMRLCNALNIDAQERAGGFQLPKISGHEEVKTFQRGAPRPFKLIDGVGGPLIDQDTVDDRYRRTIAATDFDNRIPGDFINPDDTEEQP